MDEDSKNLETQRQLYGEPLGELVRRYGQTLGVTQARLADLLGVSAPMLSQLANGRRVRFGNPASVQRLQVMDAAVREVARGELGAAAAIERLEQSRDTDIFTTTRSMDEPGLAAVRRVFSAAGGPDAHLAAAAAIEQAEPAIAAMLRAYGAGSEREARAAFAALG